MKLQTTLKLFAVAILISLSLFCLLTFVVLPGDVFRKSTYHVEKRARVLKHSKYYREEVHSGVLAKNSSGIFEKPLQPPSNKHPLQEVHVFDEEENGDGKSNKTVSGSNKVAGTGGRQKNADTKIDQILLANTLRNAGMHPERAQLLISNIKIKEGVQNHQKRPLKAS